MEPGSFTPDILVSHGCDAALLRKLSDHSFFIFNLFLLKCVSEVIPVQIKAALIVLTWLRSAPPPEGSPDTVTAAESGTPAPTGGLQADKNTQTLG